MAIITIENLGKRYRLGQLDPYRTFRQVAGELLAWPVRSLRGHSEEPEEAEDLKSLQARQTLWALRNASLEVKQGEVVGIIGKNGSGKSTMLKILARITSPTEGSVHFRGRIGSMLEVGTGFHPELTGRENVYLNGAILGMRKREIDTRFDEIAAYSGVERFLDTPVKRYSSGMYVRLAFSVAAHMDSDILLIDEVLSVGDVDFQRKCLRTMHSLPETGKTILFVSHSLWAIRRLCSRVILLDGGRIIADGETEDVIKVYLGEDTQDIAAMGSPTGDAEEALEQ